MEKPTFVDDHRLILEAIDQYIEGCAKADSSVMRPAFDDRATLSYLDGEGKLISGPVPEMLFEPVDRDFAASPEAKSAVVRVDIVGNAASARVDTNDLYGFCFTDFFHLLKIEGRWKIVNKVFHTHD